MAFKITQKPSFKALVSVYTPNQKGGHDLSKFTAEYKRVTFDELDELRKLPQKEVLQSVTIGFEDLIDDDNNSVDFNETNLAILLNMPDAVAGMAEAFWTSVVKGREKN